jgi:hypothetical protein
MCVCVLTGVESLSSVISLFRYVKGKENKDGSVHTMKACSTTYSLNLEVDGGKWSVSRPGHFSNSRERAQLLTE